MNNEYFEGIFKQKRFNIDDKFVKLRDMIESYIVVIGHPYDMNESYSVVISHPYDMNESYIVVITLMTFLMFKF